MSFKLLPKSTEEFSDTKFWEGFFKTRGSKAFEWYGEYQDMVELWAQYVKTGDRVLNIGCGNSNLGAELHDYQSCEVLCIDTSSTVVKQMARKHSKRPRLSYRVMDAARLQGLDDASFACAVDKGTLDALMSAAADSTESISIVDAMLAEVHRVLRVGGRHLIVSLCQKQVVDKLMQHISSRSWIARIHQATSGSTSDSSNFPLPVFFIALTKLRPAEPGPASSIVQVQDAYSTGPPERLESVLSLANWIRQVQLTAYSLSRSSESVAATAMAQADGDSQMTQFSYLCGRTCLPAFTCHLLSHVGSSSSASNSRSRCRTGYAVFIEPLGASGCRMSPSNRRDLLESQANLRRLLFVRLHPWLHYQSDSALQASLSRLVMAFAPRPGMPESEVPFLSTGQSAYPYHSVANQLGYVVEQSDRSDADKETRLLRPESDLSPLLCRANQSSTVSPLDRLLDALIGDDGDSVFLNWPCDLNWLLARNSSSRPLLYTSSSSLAAVANLLAEHFGLTWSNRPSDFVPNSFRLVTLFPSADSLASYAGAMSPEFLASLSEAVRPDGCLLLATRLFNCKPQALDVNQSAVQWLRQSGRFSSVVCATFLDWDFTDNQTDEDKEALVDEDQTDAEQRRWWIACASGSTDLIAQLKELIASLPSCQMMPDGADSASE